MQNKLLIAEYAIAPAAEHTPYYFKGKPKPITGFLKLHSPLHIDSLPLDVLAYARKRWGTHELIISMLKQFWVVPIKHRKKPQYANNLERNYVPVPSFETPDDMDVWEYQTAIFGYSPSTGVAIRYNTKLKKWQTIKPGTANGYTKINLMSKKIALLHRVVAELYLMARPHDHILHRVPINETAAQDALSNLHIKARN